MLRRLAVLFLSLATFGLLAAPSAFAVRQLIVFKTNVPLEIPGRVIGPGTYTVINVNTADNSGPIEIQNAKGQALGEFLTEPVMRANPATHTVLDLQKQADAPARIKDFVPAGRMNGYKFEYSRPAHLPNGVIKAGNANVLGSNG